MFDLSLIIPARNEEWLRRTIEDILLHRRGKTEIIIILDGKLADPPIDDHPDITILLHNKSVGQRAACNEGVRLARGKYIMKVDAHCSFDEGFDVKMLEAFKETGDNVVMVPLMKNLHVFDYVCKNGHRRYQSPSGPCTVCEAKTTKDVLWKAKNSPKSTSFCFDPTPHFQYNNDYAKRVTGDLTETMSLQGSCFMMTKELYLKLGINDEKFGSCGSQGLECAIKAWLSGGRVICNQRTWYAHCFRTQGKDFSFPYPQSNNQVEHAKKYARDLFFANKWPLAIHPISWLVEKFWPIYCWKDADLLAIGGHPPLAEKPTKSMVYYTPNTLKVSVAKAVQRNLAQISKDKNIPIISASLKPMDFGKNIVVTGAPGYLTMFRQILAGLEAVRTENVFFVEHDVVYSADHFDFTPPRADVWYYNVHLWKVSAIDGRAITMSDCRQVSGICVNTELAVKHYRKRLQILEKKAVELTESEFAAYVRAQGFEAGTHTRPERVDDSKSETWQSPTPLIDLRDVGNLTPTRWNPAEYRNEKFTKGWTVSHLFKIPGWSRDAFSFLQLP